MARRGGEEKGTAEGGRRHQRLQEWRPPRGAVDPEARAGGPDPEAHGGEAPARGRAKPPQRGAGGEEEILAA
jgi:hypothetical protein